MPWSRIAMIENHRGVAIRWLCATCVMLLGSGCSPTDVEEAFEIQTDSTEYELRHEGGLYWVNVEVRVTNPLDRTVFLHRQCGYGDHPSSRLRRADGDSTSISLGRSFCETQQLREPIPVGSGATYVDEVQLLSPESSSADTMELRTGKFVLVYDIQLTDAVEGWGPVDPLSPQRTTSNPFVVLPP